MLNFKILKLGCSKLVLLVINSDVEIIALFNNMRTLKFKAKLTITFYAAINHYRNAETSKWIDLFGFIYHQAIKTCGCAASTWSSVVFSLDFGH